MEHPPPKWAKWAMQVPVYVSATPVEGTSGSAIPTAVPVATLNGSSGEWEFPEQATPSSGASRKRRAEGAAFDPRYFGKRGPPSAAPDLNIPTPRSTSAAAAAASASPQAPHIHITPNTAHTVCAEPPCACVTHDARVTGEPAVR